MSAITAMCLDWSWPVAESGELGTVPGWPLWLKNTGKMTQAVYASVSLLAKRSLRQMVRLPLELCNETGALLAWSQFRACISLGRMLKRTTSVRTFRDRDPECGSDFLFNDLVYIPRLGTGVISSVWRDRVETSAL